MKLTDIIDLLKCVELTSGIPVDLEIREVVASDGMSEILAFTRSDELMITGLTNIQSIRTADIAGVSAVVYCRGKTPAQNVIDFAQKKGIPVLATKMGMFEASGLLYARGMKGNT